MSPDPLPDLAELRRLAKLAHEAPSNPERMRPEHAAMFVESTLANFRAAVDPGTLLALLDRIQALEAAAPNLVQVGWFTPGMPEGVDVGSLVDGQFSDDDEPVYRIVPGAAGPAGDPETTDA